MGGLDLGTTFCWRFHNLVKIQVTLTLYTVTVIRAEFTSTVIRNINKIYLLKTRILNLVRRCRWVRSLMASWTRYGYFPILGLSMSLRPIMRGFREKGDMSIVEDFQFLNENKYSTVFIISKRCFSTDVRNSR